MDGSGPGSRVPPPLGSKTGSARTVADRPESRTEVTMSASQHPDEGTEAPVDVAGLLDIIERVTSEARAMPLSSSVMVNRVELLALVRQLREAMPDELERARWVVREQEGILEHARTDAAEIVAEARAEHERLVSEQQVVRAAREEAERIVEAAHGTARQMRLEAEDYVDAKLANFEVVLHKTLTAVERGRERLRGRLDIDALSAPDLGYHDSTDDEV
jgi:vacuolar-type H+-ATPase subunit H